MKLHNHNNTLDTNVENETKNFGIGDASVVIEILRNRLYENKIQTLVQEYICNARDAMRELSKGNAFEVTVPTRLSPVFKVRDFGPGISPDRMANVFVMYGASTKRGTNGQTGGFGIGAKSAWSYTDSFSIVSVVDGTKRSYVAHTGVNNNGRLDLVSTDSTEEPNGTEIQVGVKTNDVEEFRRAIFRAIYFWSDRPTLKGELNPPDLVKGHMISDNVEIIDSKLMPEYIMSSYINVPLAVIDGVPYVVGDKLFNKCAALRKATGLISKRLVLHFGNGLVEVSASRESIADSDVSVQAINRMGAKAETEIKAYIKTLFKDATDLFKYAEVFVSLDKDFHLDDSFSKYGAYELDHNYLNGDLLKKIRITRVHCQNKYNQRIDKVKKEEARERDKRIILKNFKDVFFMKGTESLVLQNKRIREYLNTHSALYVLEVMKDAAGVEDTASLDQVIADLEAKDFQSITYTVAPKEARIKVSRDKTEFCLHTFDRRHTYTTLSDNTQEWLYIPLIDGEFKGYDTNKLKNLSYHLKEEHGIKICGVAPRALAMVEGEANFKPFKDWLDSYKPTDKEVNFVKWQESDHNDTVALIAELKGVKDTDLTAIVKEYKKFEDGRKRSKSVADMLIELVKTSKEVKDFIQLDEAFGKMIKTKYPLVSVVGRHSEYKSEIVHYINAKHSA